MQETYFAICRNRNQRTSIRVRYVGCSCSLEASERMRPGQSSGLFLRHSTTKRATVTVRLDFTFVLHRHVALVRHAFCQELVQMGWLRRRRQIRVQDGQEISPRRHSSWHRCNREVYARC